MCREAAEELDLRPGVPASAVVESPSVLVDRGE
jgi:molybdopterin-binding protein